MQHPVLLLRHPEECGTRVGPVGAAEFEAVADFREEVLGARPASLDRHGADVVLGRPAGTVGNPDAIVDEAHPRHHLRLVGDTVGRDVDGEDGEAAFAKTLPR